MNSNFNFLEVAHSGAFGFGDVGGASVLDLRVGQVDPKVFVVLAETVVFDANRTHCRGHAAQEENPRRFNSRPLVIVAGCGRSGTSGTQDAARDERLARPYHGDLHVGGVFLDAHVTLAEFHEARVHVGRCAAVGRFNQRDGGGVLLDVVVTFADDSNGNLLARVAVTNLPRDQNCV